MKPRAFVGSTWLAAVLCLPSVAVPGEAPFWPEAVDTVDVVGQRPLPEERLVRPRGFVQVVPLGPAFSAMRDLGDLLDGVAGVQVRRLGGVGALSLASIRGSAPSQVEVRIDDIPVASSPDGATNLALLPAHLFSRVEIGRGPMASVDGGSGAGVIRLVTPERFDLPLSIHAGAGSFGSRSLTAAGGVVRGSVSFLASGGTMSSRGDYPYLDRGATPFESADDAVVRRSNNALSQQDLLVRGRWSRSKRPGQLAAEYLLQGLWKDAGVPGTESRQTLHVHDRFRRLLQGLGARGAIGPDLLWGLAVRRQDEAERFQNPDGEVGLGRTDLQSRFLSQGMNGNLCKSIPFGETALRVDGSFSRERVEQKDLLSGMEEPDRSRNSRSLAVEAASHPWDDRIDLLGSQRWTAAEEAGAPAVSFAVPRLGGVVDVGHGLAFRLGWGRFGRLPSFVERYGRGGVQVGNPELRPEHGTSVNLGAILRWPAAAAEATQARIEVVGFSTRTQDAIVWIQNSQRTTKPENLERTRVDGAEISLRWTHRPLQSRWSLSQQATATLQDPRDDGPATTYHGRDLPYMPRRKGDLETRLDVGAVYLTHRLDHETSFFRDRYNSPAQMRGSRTLQDLEVGCALAGGRIGLALAVLNATDQRADDVQGFPLPGRSFSFDLRLSPDAGGED